MLYPITLWLWALISGLVPRLQTSDAIARNPAARPPALIYGDSAVFNDLKATFERRQKETAPEKLYLQFDRTLYQPGETTWFSAYIRNAGDLLPSLQSQVVYVELLDLRGSVLQQKAYLAFDGVASGEFDFPKELPGGLYRIKAWTRWMQNTGDTFERTLTLQKVVLPNLNLKLEFERKAFGPGDVAIARFDAFSLDNKPLAGARLDFAVSIGGKQQQAGEARTDASGRAYVRFQLPENLESSDGLLNVRIEHNNQPEAVSRAIPIVLKKIDLQFFPEGGDAVAGLPCRMAFKALNEFGKPADVEGVVLDSRGGQVAAFRSYHDGMGAFDFVPQAGERYRARLGKPVASEKTYALPESLRNGYALRLQERDDDNLSFDVSATQQGRVYLVGSFQDKLFFFKELKYDGGSLSQHNSSGTRRVTVPVGDLPPGIARFTLLDGAKTEQAERLVFVNRDKGLKIVLKPDREQYLPRDKVKMAIRVSDYAGRPVQGQFSLAVADEKLLTFADDKQGNLLASLLLEQDVKGKIEEPNFYFDPAEPQSGQALDYLLMTQGWRRFAWKEVLEGKPLAYEFPAERAAVEGVLLKHNGKPLQWAKVSLYPGGPSVETDEKGRFSFRNVDLGKYTHLHYRRDGYYPLYDYDSDIVLRDRSRNNPVPATVLRRPNASGNTLFSGQVKDETGEAIIGATVKILKGGEFVRGVITDFEGNYRTAVDPGVYNIEYSYTGYKTQKIDNVNVRAGQFNIVDATMSAGAVLKEVVVTAYKVPLIEQDNTQSGQTISSGQIKRMPTRNVNAIVATPAGARPADKEAANIKGARNNNTNYYIDGIRVSGAVPPAQDIEDIQAVTGGLGAEFGNARELEEEAPRVDEMVVVALGKKNREESVEKLLASRARIVPNAFAKPAPEKSRSQPYRGEARTFDRARVFYAPAYPTQQQPVQRTDFRSTIYWNPAVKTDRKGEAFVEFYTSDAVTNFRATLEGIGSAGQPGRGEQKFFVQKPLAIAVKTPASVIAGDVLDLHIAVTNHTDYPCSGQLNLSVPPHFRLTPDPSPAVGPVTLAPGETKIISAHYVVGLQQSDNQSVKITFSTDENVLDAFETTIRTLDRGFPVRQIAAGNSAQNAFNIHLNDPVEGTVSAVITAYPNALEDVLKGMERMLRQPSGCFEQVSSSNYPNLLVLDLLRRTGTLRPEVESGALSLLEEGYQKLTAYECKSGGFDWWGRDPAHEGLTAYGILEFTDMSRVFNVDKKLIDRTVGWLYKRRDGKGGWTLNPNSLHGWQNDPVVDCYIVWALAEAGYGKKFTAEVDQAYEQALKSSDSYQMALLANALLALDDPRGKTLAAQLREKQDANGSWLGSSHSVMYAYGDCFRIETTALAALALMKSNDRGTALSKAMEYLVKSKTEYGYGSTQSTVMALKALVEYAGTGSRTDAGGTLVVMVDGRRAAEQPFSTKDLKRLEIRNIEQYFTNNDPRLEVFFENPEAVIPFDLEVKYASRQPRNAPNCPLAFQTVLGARTAAVGETVRLTATLQNTTSAAQASPMVVLGIPAGLTLQPWQLKKLVDEKKCDFYELWDGFAVFHFEQIAPGETRQLDLDLRADVAGAFEAPASQAFLYYANDRRVWSKPERLTVEGGR